MTYELLATIHHELGHDVPPRLEGTRVKTFELEYAQSGDWFGDAPPDFREDDSIESAVVSLFCGPLAEVRFRGGKKKIDKDKSLNALANALVESPRVYFEEIDEPEQFDKAYFGTDWKNVCKALAIAKQYNSSIDEAAVFKVLLGEAIDTCNSDRFGEVLDLIAARIYALDEVQSLEMGKRIDIVDTVNQLLDELIES